MKGRLGYASRRAMSVAAMLLSLLLCLMLSACLPAACNRAREGTPTGEDTTAVQPPEETPVEDPFPNEPEEGGTARY